MKTKIRREYLKFDRKTKYHILHSLFGNITISYKTKDLVFRSIRKKRNQMINFSQIEFKTENFEFIVAITTKYGSPPNHDFDCFQII